MNYVILAVLMFVFCCDVLYGQNYCEIPIEGSQGQCRSIFKCQTLLSLVNKEEKTVEDTNLLNLSHCGIDDDAPAVCCPEPNKPLSCKTPEGKQGQCINLYSCPSMLSLLTPPVSKNKLQFVEDSKCNGTDQYSVCCGPVPQFEDEKKLDCELTAFPPDPSTECCGIDSRFNIQIGGMSDKTTVYQYPWLVLIQYDRFGLLQFQFSGVLISAKYVLTAARAVAHTTRKNGIPVNIRLGDYNSSHEGPDCTKIGEGVEECTDGAFNIPIDKTIPHPQYNSKDKTNDIALIRMIRNAPFTDFIRPICLPTTDVSLKPDVVMTAAGWGTSGLWQMISDTKLQADFSYVSRALCQELYSQQSTKITLGKGHICIGAVKNEDSCRGDNVLMYKNGKRYECIGIVSFGAIPCQQVVPVVYTNVYTYLSWIKSTITS